MGSTENQPKLDLFWLMLTKHRLYKRCPAARSVTRYVDEDPKTGGMVERVKHLVRLALGPLKRRNAKSKTGTENCKKNTGARSQLP